MVQQQGRAFAGSAAARAAASSSRGGSFHLYPPPLAKYEDVIANRQLFMTTLENLHTHMATKFMIPIIGGRDLDLHKLFLEVTSRGGIDKILREKRWKDVTATFNFPSTATNASFVLRKYYYSLLQHYERLYYFKAQGWTLSPTGTLQHSATTTPVAVAAAATPSPLHVPTVQQPRREFVSGAAAGASSSSSSVDSSVIGVIDGKFESGYLVTVTIGKEKLKGVLYQAPPTINQGPQTSGVSTRITDSIPKTSSPNLRRKRKRRKKSEIRKRDPDHPKPNRSGYNFFFAEQHARLKPLHPGRDREISRMIGELWNNLKDNDRAVYQDIALKDKERYQKEMENYRERLSNQVISNAVPIQQRFPVMNVGMAEVKEGTTARDHPPQRPEDESDSSKSDIDEEEEDDDDFDDDDDDQIEEENDDDMYDDDDYDDDEDADDDETLSNNTTYPAAPGGIGIGVESGNAVGTCEASAAAPVGIGTVKSGNVVAVGTSEASGAASVGFGGVESGNVLVAGTSEASAVAAAAGGGGGFQVEVDEDDENVCDESKGINGHTPGKIKQNSPYDHDAQQLTSIPPTMT